MKEIVGLGAGGHALSVLDALEASGVLGAACRVVGLLDADPRRHGTTVRGIPILGGDELMPELVGRGVGLAFVGIAGTGDNRLRRRVFDAAVAAGLEPLVVAHPSAVISPSAERGRGVFHGPATVVGAGAVLGDDVVVNSGAVVEHECRVGAHVHVATGACLAGGVTVEEGAHLGAGAVVREGVRIGAWAVVGAGAVVVADVAPGATVVGVPARPLR